MRRVPLAIIRLVLGEGGGHGSHKEAGVGGASLHFQLPLP